MAQDISGNRPVRVGAVAGIVLAGGHGRRLFPGGGDKAMAVAAGRPLVSHVVERLRPQVLELALSANGPPDRFARLRPRLPADVGVIADSVLDQEGETVGPLGGLLAGLEWARQRAPYCPLVVTVPVDVPLLPFDLVPRLAGHMHVVETDVLVVRAGGRSHHTIALWNAGLTDVLREAIVRDGVRRVEDFIGRLNAAVLDWPSRLVPYDPFLNVNTPDDLAAAQRILESGKVPMVARS